MIVDAEEDVEEKQKSVVTSRQTTIEMAIPRKAVGAVIGRQGQTIKEVFVWILGHVGGQFKRIWLMTLHNDNS